MAMGTIGVAVAMAGGTDWTSVEVSLASSWRRLSGLPIPTVAPYILFLGVHALGDAATWPPERHSRE
jgi:hypothetical protein